MIRKKGQVVRLETPNTTLVIKADKAEYLYYGKKLVSGGGFEPFFGSPRKIFSQYGGDDYTEYSVLLENADGGMSTAFAFSKCKILTEKPEIDNIRVLLMTTNFTSLFHSEIRLSCDVMAVLEYGDERDRKSQSVAAGETITMPYTDQTLFAVYTSRVSFEDGDGDNVTTYDDVSEGDVVDIPAPAAQGDAIFEGWYDRSSGQYLSPDETQYTVRGMGADFTALYSKLEAKEISTGHWNTGAIPTGTQIPLTFTLANSGTEDEDGIQVTVSSDSAYARLMNTSAYVRSMDAGDVRTLKGVLLVVDSECPSGQEIPVTVTMSDDDGAVFTSTFTLTTR